MIIMTDDQAVCGWGPYVDQARPRTALWPSYRIWQPTTRSACLRGDSVRINKIELFTMQFCRTVLRLVFLTQLLSIP